MSTATSERRVVTLRIVGKPEPKGSARAFVPLSWAREAVAAGRQPRAVVTSDNPHAASWQSLIRGCAQTLYEPPFGGPVQVAVVFRLPRPKSLPRKVTHPVAARSGDIDKLARSVLDALTGVLFADDAAVVDLRARKVFTLPDAAPGAEITVAEAVPFAADAPALSLFDEPTVCPDCAEVRHDEDCPRRTP